MANVGEITWQTNRASFLKESDISELVSSMEKGDLNDIDGGFATPMTNEMGAGLSLEALNIDGRAPLNEIALELSDRINTTIEDMAAIKQTAQGEGNKHRQDEANTYYEKVIEEYQKTHFKKVEDAWKQYDGHRTYYVEDKNAIKEKEYDSNGNAKTNYKEKIYNACHVNMSIDAEVSFSSEPQEADPEDVKPGAAAHEGYVNNLKGAVRSANDFYNNYVVPAKELKEECAGLDTSTGSTTAATAATGGIYGVQAGAKVEHYNYSPGKITEVYKNPDGSKVTVERDTTNGDITFQRLEDENGNVTELRYYDSRGELKEKYTFEITDLGNGVYESIPTHYVATDMGHLALDEHYDSENNTAYYWTDENGNRNAGSEPPAPGTNTIPINLPIEEKFYNYEDEFTASVKKREDFELPEGYELKYDGNWLFGANQTFRNRDLKSYKGNPITFKYNSGNDTYEVFDKDGATGIYLDPDRMIGGDNNYTTGLFGNDTSLWYDVDKDGYSDIIADSNYNDEINVVIGGKEYSTGGEKLDG